MNMISIIIPTQNRCDLLEITLISLVKLNYDFNNCEILIIDNDSLDNTKKVSEKIINQNKGKNIRYIFEPIPGLQPGRQRGVVESKGEILVFIDDDIVVQPDWLAAIENSFKDETVHLIGGKCLPKYEIEPPFWTEYLWIETKEYKMCSYYSLIDQGDEVKETNPNFVFGLNFSIRKKTLLALGGFHPDCIPKKLQRFQGDGETGLTMKLINLKLKAIYNPKVFVYHFVTKERMTFQYIEKRMFYQGVCDSFTEIRRKKQQVDLAENTVKTNKYISKYNILEKIKCFITGRNITYVIDSLKQQINDFNSTRNELFERSRIAYKRGYDFHQKEINNDPKLLEWVLKEDYFDYDYTKYL